MSSIQSTREDRHTWVMLRHVEQSVSGGRGQRVGLGASECTLVLSHAALPSIQVIRSFGTIQNDSFIACKLLDLSMEWWKHDKAIVHNTEMGMYGINVNNAWHRNKKQNTTS
jgi:hypothetical protein